MKGNFHFTDVSNINPFISFCRLFDDLGSENTFQIVGEYIVIILNMVIISFHIIATTYVTILTNSGLETPYTIQVLRRLLGCNHGVMYESLYSNISIYPTIIILFFSIVSFSVRSYQTHFQTAQSLPVLCFNAIFDTLSPVFATWMFIVFFSSFFNFLIYEDNNSLKLLIYSILSLPMPLFGIVRIISNTRMDKLPYIAPLISQSVSFYFYLVISIMGSIYIEYSIKEKYTVLFISFLIFALSLFTGAMQFFIPLFNNRFHCMTCFIVTFISLFSFYSTFVLKLRKTEAKSSIKFIVTWAGSFSIVAFLHLIISAWWIRRHIKSREIIDPKNYSLRRLFRLLCFADVDADQSRFPTDFPEKVFQRFPKNHTIVIYSILYKLYDPTSHKLILDLAERLAALNTTNFYISSMLRSIIFVASGNQNGSSYTEEILQNCYRHYEKLWFYIIQNNISMTTKYMHDISKLIQVAHPFFDRHKSLLHEYHPFIKNITFRPDDSAIVHQELSGDHEKDSENKESTEISEISIVDEFDESLTTRIKSISSASPKYFKALFSVLCLILAIVFLITIIPCFWIISAMIKTLDFDHRTKDLFEFYKYLIPCWVIPSYYRFFLRNNETIDVEKTVITNSIGNISNLYYFKNKERNSQLLIEARDCLLQTLDDGNFTRCKNVTNEVLKILFQEGREIFTAYMAKKDSVNKIMASCSVFVVLIAAICVILFFVAWKLGINLLKYLSNQLMHLDKSFSVDIHTRYTALIGFDIKKPKSMNSIVSNMFYICFFTYLPVVISLFFTRDMSNYHKKYINYVSTSIYIAQSAGIIAYDNILLPSFMENTSTKEDLNSLASNYEFMNTIVNKFIVENMSNVLNYSIDDEMAQFILKGEEFSDKELIDTVVLLNQNNYVDFFNATTILLRDMYIVILEAAKNKSLTDIIKMSLPSAIYCAGPTANLIDNMITHRNSFHDEIIFAFFMAPFTYLIVLSVTANYSLSMIKLYLNAIDLTKRIICLQKIGNPFLDENDNFTGFKEPLKNIVTDVFNALQIPIFQTKDEKIIGSNQIAETIFGDVLGTDSISIPNELVDRSGEHHYFQYTSITKKYLPDELSIVGNGIILSDDLTNLTSEKKLLKNLHKDIKLSFSIPSILQRDRPTHLQSIVVVNFCFASDLSNDLFLDFGSNIEDVFGQYTSFFMFEKQRFAFYVLFHDDKDLRQPSRDAVSFSLLARDIAKLNHIDVKIAISIEKEVTAKAEKIDMIWSVNFPNSILWRTDAMLKYADWGKIVCFSKVTSGIHYSKYITLGKYNEQSEIVIL